MCWWKAFLMALALTLLAIQVSMNLYIVQEVFSVLLATAVAVMVLMLITVTFVLLQGVSRHALSWLKTGNRVWPWSTSRAWKSTLRESKRIATAACSWPVNSSTRKTNNSRLKVMDQSRPTLVGIKNELTPESNSTD
jgi:hypothetical protein